MLVGLDINFWRNAIITLEINTKVDTYWLFISIVMSYSLVGFYLISFFLMIFFALVKWL